MATCAEELTEALRDLKIRILAAVIEVEVVQDVDHSYLLLRRSDVMRAIRSVVPNAPLDEVM